MQVVRLDTVGSTMDECRSRLESELVVTAREQTAGRGRNGKSWYSPSECGVYFTYGVKMPAPPPALSLTTGLFLARELGDICCLKWPNDIFVSGSKLGGILIEVDQGVTLVGVGINLKSSSYGPGLRELGINISEERLHQAVSRAVTEHCLNGFAPFAGSYQERMLWLGEEIEIEGFSGTLQGVTQSGALLVSGREFFTGSPMAKG